MFTKLFMGSTVTMVVACAIMFGLWKGAVAKTEALQAEVTLLDNANKAQTQTINSLTALATANAHAIGILGDRNNEITQATQQLNAKIEGLRAGERQKALANSFLQSEDAYNRRRDILMRVDVCEEGYHSAPDSCPSRTSDPSSPN